MVPSSMYILHQYVVFPTFACVYVQLMGSPSLRLLLVCWLIHSPLVLVANVAVRLAPVSGSFTVAPTAICRSCPVLWLVGCSPVMVGAVFASV